MTNTIFTVQTGEEAIGYFKGEAIYADRQRFPLPRTLLLDLRLPGMSGFEVLESLIKDSLLKGVLIVVISAQTEIFQVRRAYSLGAHTFLAKPIHERDVVNLVKAFREFSACDQLLPNPVEKTGFAGWEPRKMPTPEQAITAKDDLKREFCPQI